MQYSATDPFIVIELKKKNLNSLFYSRLECNTFNFSLKVKFGENLIFMSFHRRLDLFIAVEGRLHIHPAAPHQHLVGCAAPREAGTGMDAAAVVVKPFFRSTSLPPPLTGGS